MTRNAANRLLGARSRPVGFAVLAGFMLSGCLGGRPTAVSPQEIPELESRLTEDPNDANLMLRYAAALFSAGRCDTASAVAIAGGAMRPSSAIAPLVIGQCHEQAEDFDQAVAVYQAFVRAYPDERGADAVRARQMLTLRERANSRARQALAQEAQLGAQQGDPSTLAVLPIDIAGDSIYQPLSRGLAQILTSDLALLQRFRMVERMQVQALVQEMRLGETGRFDAATAARMGRLLRAGRMVQGLASIPSEEEVQFSAAVIQSDGQVTSPAGRSGRLRDILQMEKEIVVDLAAQLGYQLSEAERLAILENGTQNLTAFLAYSNGLVAEEIGDFSAAALYYQQAVQADPGFQAARDQYKASAAAPAAEQASAGDVTTVSAEAVQEPDAIGVELVADAVNTSIADVAATTTEQTSATGTTAQPTQQASGTTASAPPPTIVNKGVPITVTGVVRIIFRLP